MLSKSVRTNVNVEFLCTSGCSNSSETFRLCFVGSHHREYLPGFSAILSPCLVRKFGHTFLGLFFFRLLFGLITLWLFHNILKYPSFSLLPENHQQRLYHILDHFRFGPPKHFLVILISLFLGSCTHLLWDSCVHFDGWTVRHFPFLSLPLIHTSLGTLKLYKVLHLGGTLVGSGLLVYWYAVWFQTAPKSVVPSNLLISKPLKYMLITILSLSSVLSVIIYSHKKASIINDVWTFGYFVLYAFKTGTLSLIAALFVWGLLWQATRMFLRSCH